MNTNLLGRLTITEWMILFIPMLSGFIVNMLFRVGSSAGENINARPPPYVFGIAWTILYLLLGYSWIKLRGVDKTNDILFICLVSLLCLWIVIYYYNKKYALYELLFCFMITFFIIIYNSNENSSASGGLHKYNLLLIPLLTWIFFATLLNYTEVNMLRN